MSPTTEEYLEGHFSFQNQSQIWSQGASYFLRRSAHSLCILKDPRANAHANLHTPSTVRIQVDETDKAILLQRPGLVVVLMIGIPTKL